MTQYIIGLTGGIASGKTTVLAIIKKNFESIGTICADQIAKEIIDKSDVILQLKKYFGNYIINNKNNINRALLRETISTNNKARENLNSIMHPAIRSEIMNQISLSNKTYIIVDIPLLSLDNIKDYSYLKYVIMVSTNRKTRIKRIMKRDSQTKKQAINILETQINNNERLKISDFIIYNNSDELEILKKETLMVFQKILEKCK